MKNYSTILFDLDGTIIDSAPGVIKSVWYALLHYGYTEETLPKKEDLLFFIGPPLDDSFARVLGDDQEKVQGAIAKYRVNYQGGAILDCTLYTGVRELLARLSRAGKKLILATSKPEIYAKQIMDHHGLTEYFTCIGGASLDNSRQNKEDVIAYALQKVGNPPIDECVMVGDRIYDINGAKTFSMDSIGVLYGFGSREELENAGATYIAKTAEAVGDMLLDL